MDDFEDGELPESDEEQNNDQSQASMMKLPAANGVGMGQMWNRRQPVPNYRASGKLTLSSSDETSDSDRDEDNDELIFKRKKTKQSEMEFQPSSTFQNPLLNKGQSSWVGMMSKQKQKNNIWGSVLQEQTLSQGLGGFGVDKGKSDIDGDRNVEAYDYTKAAEDDRPVLEADDTPTLVSNDPFDQVIQTDTTVTKNTMQSNDRKRKRPIKDRLGSLDFDKNKPRGHIQITENDPEDKVVSAIAVALNEPKKDLMERVVKVMGVKKSLQLLYQTEDVEEAGGLWINDGSRRRTPGGVFLQLLKADPSATKEHLDNIFIDSFMFDKEKQKEAKRRKRRRKAEEARRRMEIGLRTMNNRDQEIPPENTSASRKHMNYSSQTVECDMDNRVEENHEDDSESEDDNKDFESLLKKHREVQEKKKVDSMESEVAEVPGTHMELGATVEPEISIDIEDGETID